MASLPPARARWQPIFAALGGAVIGWRIGGKTGMAVAAAVIGTASLAWLAPRAYAPIQRGLDALTRAILVVFTWACLGVVYFLVFAPIRWWRSLRRRDPLHQAPDPKLATYLERLEPVPADRFRRQF